MAMSFFDLMTHVAVWHFDTTVVVKILPSGAGMTRREPMRKVGANEETFQEERSQQGGFTWTEQRPSQWERLTSRRQKPDKRLPARNDQYQGTSIFLLRLWGGLTLEITYVFNSSQLSRLIASYSPFCCYKANNGVKGGGKMKRHHWQLKIAFLLLGCSFFFMQMLYLNLYVHKCHIEKASSNDR
jgi:hypothetical protein